jgi:hypothetical protein
MKDGLPAHDVVLLNNCQASLWQSLVERCYVHQMHPVMHRQDSQSLRMPKNPSRVNVQPLHKTDKIEYEIGSDHYLYPV